jgi:hypothetical protein
LVTTFGRPFDASFIAYRKKSITILSGHSAGRFLQREREMTITVSAEGRRHYLQGDTYPLRKRIKEAGGHWDADRRAWWIADATKAEQLAASAAAADADAGDGDATIVAARVRYNGRLYYWVGRAPLAVRRGLDRRGLAAEGIQTQDGLRLKLAFKSGAKTFWAPRDDVFLERRYKRPQTIGALRRYAEDVRSGRVRTCRMCGSPQCEGVHGGLCEHD